VIGSTDDEERRLTPLVPHAITFLGHGLTLAWLLGAPLGIGVVGLLCDAADGFSARWLRVGSAYGALYDWTVDVTVCALVMQRLGALPLLLVLVPLQVHAHRAGRHVSGRAFASIMLAVITRVGSWRRG
jgi:phosphatidylglycerophosphate synthase